MKLKIMAYCLLGILLAGILGACSQPTQPQDNTDISEFEFLPDGLSLNSTTAPRMVVRLGIAKDSVTNQRSGKVVVSWSDQGGSSHLTGNVSVKLRQVGSTTALAELNNAAVDSAYLAPTILQTSGTLQTGALCVEVTAWDLSAGAYTFNTQSLPLVFCHKNNTETGADVAVSLDANSETTVSLTKTFPFVIATQNLGKQAAKDVVVTVTLSPGLEFVSEDSIPYDCTATVDYFTDITCTRNRAMPVSRWGLPLMLKGKYASEGEFVNVQIDTTSTDPNLNNNSFIQDIYVTNVCGAALFPDNKLRAKVKTALGFIEDEELCIDTLGGLTSLTANSQMISDLTGLEYATNLTTLNLLANQISDISALAGLTNLTTLYLSGNTISDISALSSLTNLTTLYLDNNQISDISGLSSLTNLTSLYLFRNQISDISALSSLTNLTSLDLKTNQIIDISAVSSLTNLTSLDLKTNQIIDISAVSSLTNLTSLDLKTNQIIDISGLSGMTSLTHLYLGSNQISSVPELSGMTSLGFLSLDDNQISDISALAGLTNLFTLQVRSNQISDISGLSSLTGLTSLSLNDNQISDISALAGLTNLIVLELPANQISDISALVSNTGLGSGDFVDLASNSLSSQAFNDIATLEGRGVFVNYDF